MFIVNSLKKELSVEVIGIKTKLQLNWAKGMIGAIPVFETQEQAEEYANGSPITEIQYAPPKD